jgi:two-component system response regulator AtoC
MTAGTILLIEDERTLARAIQAFLTEEGYEVVVAHDAEMALQQLETVRPDLVFSDVRLPGMDGITLLKRLQAFDAGLPVIILTAHGSVEGAVEAMKLGAFHYLKKPVDLDELKLLAERARESRAIRQELRYYRTKASPVASGDMVIGTSRAIRDVLERAREIAALEDTPPVLITGETGTGKGLIARTIHASGPRATKPFIEVNCTALPASLMEAELFGYERGAFTDAKESKLGLFEAAEGGFLFLDEVGDLETALQGKLLRAIEERVVRRVGGIRDRRVNVRILAATNRDLAGDVGGERFRRDLYYRLAVLVLHLPPLRERGDDVLLLADRGRGRRPARLPVAGQCAGTLSRHRAGRAVEPGRRGDGGSPGAQSPARGDDGGDSRRAPGPRPAAAGSDPGAVGTIRAGTGPAGMRRQPDPRRPAAGHLPRHAPLSDQEIRPDRRPLSVQGAAQLSSRRVVVACCSIRVRKALFTTPPAGTETSMVTCRSHRTTPSSGSQS